MSAAEKYSALTLAVICPMANEKDTAERFIQEVLAVCRPFGFKSLRFYAILDRASTDGTLDILKNLSRTTKELTVVYAPENKNVVDAYKRGYSEAIASKADWTLEIDAGYGHQPSDIPSFLKTMADGNYDCVFGSRFSPGGKIVNGSFQRFWVSFGGTQMANLLLGTQLRDMTSGFELFKTDVLRQILDKGIFATGPFFQTEIRTFAHQYKITELPITYNAATQHVHQKALADAFKQLKRLWRMKSNKELVLHG